MQVTAKLKYLHIAPRKVRLVADSIRGKKTGEAETILNFTVKKAARPLLKLLKTALADAQHNFHLDQNNFYIAKITVDEGPKTKRWMPRARGQASEIQKKTSHITLVLDEIEKGKKAKKKPPQKVKKEVSAPEKEEKKIPAEKTEKVETVKKPEFKPRPETEKPKPKIIRGIRRMFRRKSM